MKYLLPVAGLAVLIVLCSLALAGTAVVHGAGRSQPAGVPVWGTDIRVNPPVTSTADIKLNFLFAVNPSNANQVLAPYETEDSTATRSGYAWSTDAGRTWDPKLFYGPWISNTTPAGNPSGGFDSRGTAYYASAVAGDNVSGYVVLTSTVGGNWSAPLPIILTDTLHFRSQARLIVDGRSSGAFAGSLYIAWHDSTQTPGGIGLRYSRDSGRTWSADVPVSDPGHETAEQPILAVAADGGVYAAFGADDTNLYLNHSTDGGVTWGADQPIAGDTITPIGALDPKGRERLLSSGQPDSGFLINNDPRIALAPAAPETVYAVWNDGRWDSGFTLFSHPGQHGDIAFSRSTDAGATWSAPLRINDDVVKNGVDQWAPNIAVGTDGRIGVTWYDRRDDPAHLLYHLYYSESTDGGLTWSANTRVSDVPSDPMAVVDAKGNGLLGDYAGLAFAPAYALASWVDSRAGRVHDFYADRGA
ncbi:MAG: glycoside hydrolase, partial [Actinomycetota bacterium]|nr:glycoside hydrolase [Actinomycetota bacterium]